MNTVKMFEKKYCAYCGQNKILATFDTVIPGGGWAYVCDFHWVKNCNNYSGAAKLDYSEVK